jgi:hypothetical protein
MTLNYPLEGDVLLVQSKKETSFLYYGPGYDLKLPSLEDATSTRGEVAESDGRVLHLRTLLPK